MLQEEINLSQGIILGFYNFIKSDLENLKFGIEMQYKGNISYVEITEEELQKREKNLKTKNQKNELGIVSVNWIEKNHKYFPSVIVHCVDITLSLKNLITVESIVSMLVKEISKVRNLYLTSHFILIIKNFLKADIQYEEVVKKGVNGRLGFLTLDNIFTIREESMFKNESYISNLGKKISNESSSYYKSRKTYYKQQLSNKNNNIFKAKVMKINIKLGVLSILTHNENVNYGYFDTAYNILTKEINKNECPKIFNNR